MTRESELLRQVRQDAVVRAVRLGRPELAPRIEREEWRKLTDRTWPSTHRCPTYRCPTCGR